MSQRTLSRPPVTKKRRKLLQWTVYALGGAAWLLALARAAVVIATVSEDRRGLWLLDWHVYGAASGDLIDQTLYRARLEYPGWPLPVEQFNLPPLAAAWALPFQWLPGELGGLLWLAMGLAAWLSAWWLLARLLGLPHAWVWIGLTLAGYSRFFAFDIHVSVGNINDLMLGMVAAFVILHVRRMPRAAGAVLGLAIATKIWPVLLAVVLVRERRWTELGWATVIAVVATGLPLFWLGFDVITPMVTALQTTIAVDANNPVLWVTWLRESFAWWPAALSVVIAAALLIIPARGLTGIGLAVLAGLTLIPNLWGHYFPTLLVGVVLAAMPLWQEPTPHGETA